MSAQRTSLTIKLPARDPNSAVIADWLATLPPGDISALVRQALVSSPLVQGSDLRPQLDRIEAKLNQLLAQPTQVRQGESETILTASQGTLSPLEQEALANLFDFGG